MKYLRAKYDFSIYGTKDKEGVRVFYFLEFFPKGALITPKEWSALTEGFVSLYFEGQSDSLGKQTSDETFFLEEVNISRKRTYFFFGARKEIQTF